MRAARAASSAAGEARAASAAASASASVAPTAKATGVAAGKVSVPGPYMRGFRPPASTSCPSAAAVAPAALTTSQTGWSLGPSCAGWLVRATARAPAAAWTW